MALVATVSCTVGPDYQPPQIDLPDRWSEGPEGTITLVAEIAEWWTVFNDPTLNQLIEQAVQSNLDLQIAQARVCEARAQRSVVAADLWPRAQIASSYAFQGTSLNKTPDTARDSFGRQIRDTIITEAADDLFDSSFTTSKFAGDVIGETLSNQLIQKNTSNNRPRFQNLFDVGFDASWEIDVFGGLRRNIEAAEAQTDAAKEDCHDVLVTLVSEVARNYVEAVGYQHRLVITRKNIEAQQQTLALARLQYEGGLTSELDIAQAQAELSSTQSQVSILETSFKRAMYQVSFLVGKFPEATLAEFEREAPIPLVPPEIPVGLPSDLLRRRPDIRRSERQLAATNARIGAATADLFPRFSLTGSFGSAAHDIRHVLDSKSLFWNAGPKVSWLILDADRILANINVQRAVWQQALGQYQLTILRAIKEVEAALIACQNERERYQYLIEAVNANRLGVSLTTAQYREGTRDFLAVVDSQRALYTSQDRLVQSQVAATLHAIAIFKALGGGWDRGCVNTCVN